MEAVEVVERGWASVSLSVRARMVVGGGTLGRAGGRALCGNKTQAIKKNAQHPLRKRSHHTHACKVSRCGYADTHGDIILGYALLNALPFYLQYLLDNGFNMHGYSCKSKRRHTRTNAHTKAQTHSCLLSENSNI